MENTNAQIISISLPQTLAKAVDEETKLTKRSKSQVVQDAIKQYLWVRRWNVLQARGVEQAIRLGIKQEDVESLIHEYRNEARTRRT